MGYHLDIIWVLFGHHLGIIWTSFGHHLDIIWTSFGHHSVIIRASFGQRLGIIWGSFGHYLQFIEILMARGTPGGEAPQGSRRVWGAQAPQWSGNDQWSVNDHCLVYNEQLAMQIFPCSSEHDASCELPQFALCDHLEGGSHLAGA